MYRYYVPMHVQASFLKATKQKRKECVTRPDMLKELQHLARLHFFLNLKQLLRKSGRCNGGVGGQGGGERAVLWFSNINTQGQLHLQPLRRNLVFFSISLYALCITSLVNLSLDMCLHKLSFFMSTKKSSSLVIHCRQVTKSPSRPRSLVDQNDHIAIPTPRLAQDPHRDTTPVSWRAAFRNDVIGIS